MKRKFEKSTIKIVYFTNSDIITTSNDGEENFEIMDE